MDPLIPMAEAFKLLGDKTRLAIIAYLRQKELCVCELVELLAMSQPAVSQHLRKLRAAGLVRERRQGQWIYYSLALEDKPYLQQTLAHLPSQEEALKRLGPGDAPDRCS